MRSQEKKQRTCPAHFAQFGPEPTFTNFLLNVDNATSADIEGLGELVKRRVYEHSGVLLEWEIQRVGRP